MVIQFKTEIQYTTLLFDFETGFHVAQAGLKLVI